MGHSSLQSGTQGPSTQQHGSQKAMGSGCNTSCSFFTFASTAVMQVCLLGLSHGVTQPDFCCCYCFLHACTSTESCSTHATHIWVQQLLVLQQPMPGFLLSASLLRLAKQGISGRLQRCGTPFSCWHLCRSCQGPTYCGEQHAAAPVDGYTFTASQFWWLRSPCHAWPTCLCWACGVSWSGLQGGWLTCCQWKASLQWMSLWSATMVRSLSMMRAQTEILHGLSHIS